MKETNKTGDSVFNLSANCYFCRMTRNLLFFIIFLGFSTGAALSQSFVRTSDIFKRSDDNFQAGQLNLQQDPAIDSLIDRYILMSKKIHNEKGYYGMDGFRIQIYSSSNRNAKVESGLVKSEFMSQFPDIDSYQLFAEPAWYKIRVGNFRSRTEAIRLYFIISKKFPKADLVPDIINLQDLNLK